MLPAAYYTYFLLIGAALFGIGAFGVILRRNVLLALMSIELMLNAGNLTLLTFARARHDMHGHALAFLVIAVAAAEAAIGLAIVIAVFRNRKSTNLDDLTLMKN
jgi:NADH-quinone oxidoreductase subunit K